MWRKRSRSGALLRSGDEAGAHVGAGFELDAVEQSRGATANNGGARQRLSALCGQSVSQSVSRSPPLLQLLDQAPSISELLGRDRLSAPLHPHLHLHRHALHPAPAPGVEAPRPLPLG